MKKLLLLTLLASTFSHAQSIAITGPTEALTTTTGNADYVITYTVNHGNTIFCEAKNQNGLKVGGKNIASPIIGAETIVTWENLNTFDNDLFVGDTFTVECIQWGPKLASSILNVNVVATLGIDDVSKLPFTGYPVPVRDYLNISDSNNAKSFQVFDMVGKKVMDDIPAARRIDLSSLKTGVYILVSDVNRAFRFVKL